MGLAAGRLRERVTITREVQAEDGKGGYTATKTNLCTVWAEVIALRGGEALSAAALRSTQLYRVTIRIRNDLLPTDRIEWRGITMDIKALAPTPERDAIVMTCESGSNS